MSHKTKAAMQGRQCHYQKLKQSQDTRVNAGGQSLSVPVITGTAPLARLRGMSKSGCSLNRFYTSCVKLSASFYAHLQTTQKLGCLGYEALAHTLFPQIWGELDQRAGCTAMQHTPGKSRSFDRYPDIGYHSLSACLAFLRWRRLISFSKAATTNCPVLSPSCFNNSTSSAMWCGTRTSNLFDFAFTDLVAIARFLNSWCPTIISKKKMNAILDVSDTLALVCVRHLMFSMVSKKTTPRTVRAVPRRLTKPLYEVTIMADLQHTQTRPEFTWRFISTTERYPAAKPLVIYVNASSEQEARDTMPGVNLIFAARLPFHAFQVMEVRHA